MSPPVTYNGKDSNQPKIEHYTPPYQSPVKCDFSVSPENIHNKRYNDFPIFITISHKSKEQNKSCVPIGIASQRQFQWVSQGIFSRKNIFLKQLTDL